MFSWSLNWIFCHYVIPKTAKMNKFCSQQKENNRRVSCLFPSTSKFGIFHLYLHKDWQLYKIKGIKTKTTLFPCLCNLNVIIFHLLSVRGWITERWASLCSNFLYIITFCCNVNFHWSVWWILFPGLTLNPNYLYNKFYRLPPSFKLSFSCHFQNSE